MTYIDLIIGSIPEYVSQDYQDEGVDMMKYADCIQNLLQSVESKLNPRKDASYYFESICHLIQQSDCTMDRMIPYLTEPIAPLEYGRNRIYHSNLFEVIVLNIPPQVETPIHDHGESCCCVHVVSGVAMNHVYREKSKNLQKVSSKKFREGEFFYSPHGQIHSMYNPTNHPLITLHVYTPPIEGNQIYQHHELLSQKERR